MSELGVPDVARMLKVSDRRVRQLIDAGELRARQVGGRWLVDVSSIPSAPRRSRAMSPRVAWGLIEYVEGRRAPWLSPGDFYRLRSFRDRLATDPEPELLAKSWLSARATREELSATVPDDLRVDPRVVLSGLSDPRSKMSAADHVEVYVHVDHYQHLLSDYLLVPARGRRANVTLHVTEFRPAAPVPVLLLAADLADHDGPRELGRARDLIAGALR